MRVIHFLMGRCNPDSANGVDKTVYYLSKHQSEFSCEVIVASLTEKNALPIPGVQVKTYPVPRFPFVLPKELKKDLEEWQPDIVHLHSVYIPQNAVLAWSLVKKGIPYVVTPHGGLSPAAERRRWHLKRPYKWLLELPMLNRAAFVHAVSDERFIRSYGVKAPIVTVPNGIDLEAIPNDLDREALFQRLPTLRGKRVFMFIGRLDPLHKGLDLLIKAFNQLASNNSALVIVGPDWKGGRKKIEKMISAFGLYSKVFLLSPIYGKEKFDVLAGADVFVHTSRWEGVPFAVIEACAIRKPCLVTDAADPMGKIKRYGAGIVVKCQVDAIASGLTSFAAKSKEELRVMGKAAYEMVKKEFNWRRIAQELISSYRLHTRKV